MQNDCFEEWSSNRPPEAVTGSIAELVDANSGPDITYDKIPGVLGPPFQVLEAVREKYCFFWNNTLFVKLVQISSVLR